MFITPLKGIVWKIEIKNKTKTKKLQQREKKYYANSAVCKEVDVYIYLSKVLTDNPKNDDIYFFYRSIFWNDFWNFISEHNLASIAYISWNLAFCAQFAHAYTHKTFQMCKSRSDLNRGSTHRNLNIYVFFFFLVFFFIKMTINWLKTV